MVSLSTFEIGVGFGVESIQKLAPESYIFQFLNRSRSQIASGIEVGVGNQSQLVSGVGVEYETQLGKRVETKLFFKTPTIKFK